MARKNAGATVSDSLVDVYTTPAGFTAEVLDLTVVGNSAVRDSHVTIVWHDESEGTDNIIGEYPVVGAATVKIDDAIGLVLEEGDILQAEANVAVAAEITASFDVVGSEGAPLSILHGQVPAVAVAGNDATTIIGVAPYAGVISKVTYTPATAITGADTNTRKVGVTNLKDDATGTDVAAELQFNNGVDGPASREKTITLSGTASKLVVEAGDVLVWKSTHVANGIADPGGLVTVTIDKA